MDGGYIKLFRSARSRLMQMPEYALRLYLIFRLGAEWRDGQRVPRGCIEMSYTEMQKELRGCGRSSISMALRWLESPPSGPPFIRRKDDQGRTLRAMDSRKLRIAVLDHDADRSWYETDIARSKGSPADIGLESGPIAEGAAPIGPESGPITTGTAHVGLEPGPITGNDSPVGPTVGPMPGAVDANSPGIARDRSQNRAGAGPLEPTNTEDPKTLRDPPSLGNSPGAAARAKSPDAAVTVWAEVLNRLNLTDKPPLCLIRPLGLDGPVLLFAVPNEFVADRIVMRWSDLVRQTLAEVTAGAVTGFRIENKSGGPERR